MTSNPANKKTKKVWKTAGYIGTGIIALIAVWLIVCFITGNLPMLFGYGVVRIQTGSMKPVINPGEFILIEKVSPKDIKVGDVITFKSDEPTIKDKPNTHRVEEIIVNADGSIEFVTKGDANHIKDNVTAKGEKVYGRYVKTLKSLGGIFSVVSKPFVFWPVILLTVAIMVFSSVKDIKKETKSMKNKEIDALVQQEVEKLKNQNTENPDSENNTNHTKGGTNGNV